MKPEGEAARESRFQAARRRCARACWPELGHAGVLFLAAFVTGAIYVSTWGGQPEFWQQIFGPSVMLACGHGFTNPQLAEVPGLEDFLYLRAASFDCANIPADVTLLPHDRSGLSYDAIQAFHPEPQFPGWVNWQQFHRYLLFSVALCFYLFGVAWQSLTPLYALLYATTTALAYGIFRLGMARWMATLCAALLMASPLHLEQLPQLRDYSKAPFFFLLILIAGWMIKRPRPLYLQLPLAALAGAAGGLGLGFRQDVSIAVLLCVLLLAFFSPGPMRATVWRRLGVLAVLIGTFLLVAAPILQVLLRVNNSTHDTIIGLTHYCDERLGVATPLYDFGDPFKDEYIRAMLMGYAHRTQGRTEVFRHYSEAYDAAGKAYFQEFARTFPADLLIRGYASVIRVLDELQISAADNAPRGIENQFLVRLFEWRQRALDALPGGGRYHVALLLVLLAAVSLRLGFATLVGILLLAGYPALRFSARHAFHMEIIPLFAAGVLIYWLFRGGYLVLRRERPVGVRDALARAKAPLLRVVVFLIAAALLLLVPLHAARWWQSGRVEALLEAYDRAERVLLVPQITRDGETATIALPGLATRAHAADGTLERPMYTEVLVLAFTPGPDPVDVAFEFNARHPNFQFDRTMTIPAAPAGEDGLTYLYYPVYFGAEAVFTGFTLSASARDQFQAAYRLVNTDDMRLLLNAVLPADWRTAPRYQALSR